MNKIAIIIATVVILGLGLQVARQQWTNTALRAEIDSLKQRDLQREDLAAQNTRLSNLLAKSTPPAGTGTNDQFREILKLRGEVGALRKTADEAVVAAASKSNAPSILGGITQTPEMAKMIRDQQKMGMSMIYGGFAKRAQLSPEQTEEFNNTLADNVMTNINHITDLLKSGKTAEEMDAVFTAQEAALNQQLKSMLSPEAYTEYQDYTKNLASYLTAEQFKSTLSGEKEAKDAQGKQLYELMQEETRRVLAEANLPPDYQTVPTLNFRNIASEETAEKNLQLLETIYEGVANRAGSFLNAAEMEKFAEFRKAAINNNRMGLMLNRKMMAPPQ